VRFAQTLYPTRWIGCQVDVRGDRSIVRIYVHGELIKTPERKPSGGDLGRQGAKPAARRFARASLRLLSL
jgi:hypothetical protein